MDEESNVRLVFRPTKEQYKRLHNLFLKAGQYKHMSELLRRILEIGLDNLEE